MKVSVSKKIYYRKAQIKETELTLQEMLEKAMSLVNIRERRESINMDEPIFRLINHHRSYRGMFIAQIVLIDPGASQPVVIYDDEGKEEYSITAINPSELNSQEFRKKKRDFVNSMLYFGVKGNNVVVMPSQALNIRALECHLEWLLAERCNLVTEKSAFALLKEFSKEVSKLIESYPVKSIEIGTPISFNNKPVKEDIYVDDLGISVLRSILGPVFHDMVPEDVLDSNLQAKVVISYKRKTNETGRKVLNYLGNNFRNFDDSDVKVKLQEIGDLSHDKLNLHKVIKLTKNERGLYDSTEIASQMINWLNALAETEEFIENA